MLSEWTINVTLVNVSKLRISKLMGDFRFYNLKKKKLYHFLNGLNDPHFLVRSAGESFWLEAFINCLGQAQSDVQLKVIWTGTCNLFRYR